MDTTAWTLLPTVCEQQMHQLSFKKIFKKERGRHRSVILGLKGFSGHVKTTLNFVVLHEIIVGFILHNVVE